MANTLSCKDPGAHKFATLYDAVRFSHATSMAAYMDISDSEYSSEVEWFCSQFDNPIPLDDREDFKVTAKQERERFPAPVNSAQLSEIQRSRVPQNTRKSTKWGVSVWDAWRSASNKRLQTTGVQSSEIFTYRYVPYACLCEDISDKELTFWARLQKLYPNDKIALNE